MYTIRITDATGHALLFPTNKDYYMWAAKSSTPHIKWVVPLKVPVGTLCPVSLIRTGRKYAAREYHTLQPYVWNSNSSNRTSLFSTAMRSTIHYKLWVIESPYYEEVPTPIK